MWPSFAPNLADAGPRDRRDLGIQGLRKKGGPTTLLTRFAEELRRVLGIKGLSPDMSPDWVGAGTGRGRGG